jgi:hypothetical protein
VRAVAARSSLPGGGSVAALLAALVSTIVRGGSDLLTKAASIVGRHAYCSDGKNIQTDELNLIKPCHLFIYLFIYLFIAIDNYYMTVMRTSKMGITLVPSFAMDGNFSILTAEGSTSVGL